jgi:hypothetical protein
MITIRKTPCPVITCNDAYQLDGDFYTLDRNTPYGNTNRFRDELGGNTYANGIVIDWLTARDNDRTVWGFGVSAIAAATHAVQIAAEPYTLGSFSGFSIIKKRHLFRLMDVENTTINIGEALNYAPFNYVITGSNATRLRTREDHYNDTTQTLAYVQTGGLAPLLKSGSFATMIQREFTYTELGL